MILIAYTLTFFKIIYFKVFNEFIKSLIWNFVHTFFQSYKILKHTYIYIYFLYKPLSKFFSIDLRGQLVSVAY